MKKLSNKTKDKITITIILVAIAWLIILIFCAVAQLFAEEVKPYSVSLSEKEQYNRFMAEKEIKDEMYFRAMVAYNDSMTDEERYNTFYKDDLAEYNFVMKQEAEKNA